MAWYGIRSVYHFGTKKSGKNIFMERIVCFQASDFDEAHAKADEELTEYAINNGLEVHDDQVGYRQDEEPLVDDYEVWSKLPLIDGCEVWSELYESDKSLDEFYEEHYNKYTYYPNID